MQACINACRHAGMHTCMHACMHTRKYACMNAYMPSRQPARTHARPHARAHAPTHARTHAHSYFSQLYRLVQTSLIQSRQEHNKALSRTTGSAHKGVLLTRQPSSTILAHSTVPTIRVRNVVICFSSVHVYVVGG